MFRTSVFQKIEDDETRTKIQKNDFSLCNLCPYKDESEEIEHKNNGKEKKEKKNKLLKPRQRYNINMCSYRETTHASSIQLCSSHNSVLDICFFFLFNLIPYSLITFQFSLEFHPIRVQ